MIQKLIDLFCASLLTALNLSDNLQIFCHCNITSISWIFCSYCDICTSIQNFTVHYLSAYMRHMQILHSFHFTLHCTEHYLSEVSHFTQPYYHTHFVSWYRCCSSLKHFQGYYTGTISMKLKSTRQRILQKHGENITIYIFFQIKENSLKGM